MKRDKHIYIGLDLHKFQHTAVIVDCWFEKLGEMTFQNKPSIFPSLLEYVNRFLTEGLTPVFGLEDVGGYGRDLALFIIEQGYIVKFVNSSLSNSERNSYAMTQKNDSWDAQCVADVLIRKLPYLPDATPSDIHWIIAQLVGRRNALVKAQTALKNQLHMQLNYYYPSYKEFFSEVDGKTALAFWESYPSPSHLEGETVEDLRTFLLEASNNACSTRKAEQIMSLVLADGEVKREYQTSRDFIIQSIVRDIRFKKQEIKKVDKELKVTIQKLGMQLETMPGIDTVTSSAFIAEIGDIHRFATSDKLARYAGIAPIKMGSGGKETMKKTKQGNRKLYDIFYNLAVQQVQVSKGSKIQHQETRDFLVKSIVRDISFKKQEMRYVERELKGLMSLLDFQLDTMPGIDLVTASALIAEIGDVRRFPNANKLARFAGIAPVYFGSGGKGREQKSKQGNRALHALFYNLAVQQVQVAKGSKLPRNPVFHA